MHTIESLHSLFEKAFSSEYFNEEKGVGLYRCPEKHCDTNNALSNSYRKNKLSVSYDKQIFHCWVCGYSGRLDKLAHSHLDADNYRKFKKFYKELYGYNKTFAKNKINSEQTDELLIAKQFVLLTNKQDNRKNEAERLECLSYIVNERNVPLEYIELYDISFIPGIKNNIYIPSYDKNRKLNYYVSRNISPYKKKPYDNPQSIHSSQIIFNEYAIDFNKELVIVEGIFDYLQLHGLNRTCLLGSSIKRQSSLFQKIIKHKTVIKLLFDNDASNGTQKKIERTQHLFSRWGIECFVATDILKKHNLKDTGEIQNSNRETIYKEIVSSELRAYSRLDILKNGIQKYL